MTKGRIVSNPAPRKRPPAGNPEERTQQLVSDAYDLAEKQIADGTASAAVLVHFLKMGTAREQAELARIKSASELDHAKLEQANQGNAAEKLLEQAMRAFTGYKGEEDDDDIA